MADIIWNSIALFACIFLTATSASPAPFRSFISADHFGPRKHSILSRDVALYDRDVPTITEWTALGDSYATGVGAGNPDELRRCLRYSGAYPRQMQTDKRLSGDPSLRKINNVACSGATSAQILAEQFRDDDAFDTQYGERPAFGKPQFATLTVGGDDIGFLGLIINCVIQLLPWASCDEQLTTSWSLLRDPKLVTDIIAVIDKTIEKGRTGVGDNFKLFVTSYARFFDATSDKCDDVSWSHWRFSSYKLTKSLRQSFNDMADALNNAISQAVDQRRDEGVIYVDWNDEAEGHRHCQGDNKEPDPDNDDIWFFEWQRPEPGNMDDELLMNNFSKIVDPTVDTYAALQSKNPPPKPGMVYTNSYSAIKNEDAMMSTLFTAAGDDVKTQEALTNKVRMFHPKPQLHTKIMERIFGLLETFMDERLNGCHGTSGRWYIDSSAVHDAANQFCKRTDIPSYKPVNYNPGTDNSVLLALRNIYNDQLRMPPEQECLKWFNIIIDSCDGNNPNNPHNFKFGGGQTTPDGWVYVVRPWALQATDVGPLPPPKPTPKPTPTPSPTPPKEDDSCDVTYKFFFDGFEIRGVNWSQDELGVSGDNLLAKLRGCGDVTNWNFQVTPNDVKFQWYASGNLPIGVRSCVGSAVVAAGGSSVSSGNCNGAG